VFGEVVREHRRRLAMTQAELAGKAGLSVRAIRDIESNRIGTPRLVTVRLLAKAFGLVGAEDDRFRQAALSPMPGEVAARRGPAQLPADVAGFTGRADHLDQLTALLDHDGEPPAAVVITAIAGTAGVGKTALAIHWSRRVAERFPDGQLYVNLRGFDPTGTVANPVDAVRGFLDALDVPTSRIPADPDAQVALYRSEIAGRRILIVLDNARDADQVLPLLPGTPTALVLVTSRNQLTSLIVAEGAHLLTLDLLAFAEARQFLTHRLGADRVAAEPEVVDAIITRCARLPLALAIVAARAAIRPHFPLAAVAAELDDAHGGLDALHGGDAVTNLRAVFSWSYRTLSTDAARLFRLLGVHPGPNISEAAAASVAGVPLPQVRPLLAELATAHLIVENAPDRYAFHDLLRAYAHQLAHADDVDAERRAASRRMLDHYLHTAHTADHLLDPTQDPIMLAPCEPGVTPERPADQEQATAWFIVERPVLLAMVNYAVDAGLDTYTWQLAHTLAVFLMRRGHPQDAVVTQHAALAAARRLADRPRQAHIHHFLSRTYMRLRRLDDSHTHLQRALDLHRESGNQVGQARIHLMLGLVWEYREGFTEALDHARQALELCQAANHRQGQAASLNAIGWYLSQLDDHRQALSFCQQALTILQEVGDQAGQAHTWDSLGYAHHHLGRHDEAITCFRQSIRLYQEIGDRSNEADTFVHLGETHRAAGNQQAARDAWQAALAILDELGHADAEGVRTRLDDLDQSTAGTQP